MARRICFWLVVLAPIAWIVPVARAEVTDEDVRRAIAAGVAYLEKHQKANGSWTDHPGEPGGLTALCTLALLNAGVDPAAPRIQNALDYLRGLGEPQRVYSTSLITMVLCTASPDKDAALIRSHVNWLERVQADSGPRRGGWAYSRGLGQPDNSNSQFALLALHEAERAGVRVAPSTWRAALDYWLNEQGEDGSWGYHKGDPPTGSMTCAGIASLVIVFGKATGGDASVTGDSVQCCGKQDDDDKLQRALDWLAAKFSAERNPNPYGGRGANLDKAWLYYYLYGVERVGRLTGRRFFGRRDWFREGAEFLVDRQDKLAGFWRGDFHAEENALVATSFALLFLSKGRRPVVVSKLKYGEGNDWDRHRNAVQKLARRIERRWRQDLTWQTIDVRAATVEDLLETPVLLISGRDGLPLTREQKDNLREYVNQGGFILAEACCDGEGFDRDFRALMKELFPKSPLRLLPPEHPIWYAEQKVDPNYMRPLYGVEACCRTSIVYCPQDLTCFWELSQGTRATEYPRNVEDEIEACLRTGANVITYATNRELKNKLDRPQFTLNRETAPQPERGVLYVPKLLYAGGGDEAPNALANLLHFVRAQSHMRVGGETRRVTATDPSIYEYPLTFMHGRRGFRLTAAERKALATYVQRGGVLLADAICASPEFASAFRREMQAIFPDHTLSRIPPEHPLFTRQFRGFELSRVTLRDPQIRSEDDPLKANLTSISPLLEGIEIDGRLVVIFSPYDLSCALESGSSLECKGYIKEDAAKIGTNVILFALQQ